MFAFIQKILADQSTRELDQLASTDTKIEIYKTEWCSQCRTALFVLSKINATNIHVYDIELHREKGREMVQRTGRYTIPQIFVGDAHVGGTAQLLAAAKSGKLRSLLEVDQE